MLTNLTKLAVEYARPIEELKALAVETAGLRIRQLSNEEWVLDEPPLVSKFFGYLVVSYYATKEAKSCCTWTPEIGKAKLMWISVVSDPVPSVGEFKKGGITLEEEPDPEIMRAFNEQREARRDAPRD